MAGLEPSLSCLLSQGSFSVAEPTLLISTLMVPLPPGDPQVERY